MSVKQVLVIRKDLNMRKGKMAAQAAHASMAVLLDMMVGKGWADDDNHPSDTRMLILHNKPEVREWLDGPFTKICVSVDSEEELLAIYASAKNANLYCSLITDSGKTEFNGVPTHTVVAIGPNKAEDIDKITGTLKLL